MDGAGLDNANPTILTQLPTRQAKRRLAKKGPDAKFNEVIYAKPAFAYSFSDSDDSSQAEWLGEENHGDDLTEEPIDEQEIYDLISTISDPEHPMSLGHLGVVRLPDIHIAPLPAASLFDAEALVRVLVELTPTVSHCSLATILGLAVRTRLQQALPPNYRIAVTIKPGTHSQDDQVNKQLADKERVVAALENKELKGMLDMMLATCT